MHTMDNKTHVSKLAAKLPSLISVKVAVIMTPNAHPWSMAASPRAASVLAFVQPFKHVVALEPSWPRWQPLLCPVAIRKWPQVEGHVIVPGVLHHCKDEISVNTSVFEVMTCNATNLDGSRRRRFITISTRCSIFAVVETTYNEGLYIRILCLEMSLSICWIPL